MPYPSEKLCADSSVELTVGLKTKGPRGIEFAPLTLCWRASFLLRKLSLLNRALSSLRSLCAGVKVFSSGNLGLRLP